MDLTLFQQFEVAPVMEIAIAICIAVQVLKWRGIIKESDKEYIPYLCGFIGMVLGPVAMFAMPGFPAKDIIRAVAIGGVSGIASIGVYEVFKAILKSFGYTA